MENSCSDVLGNHDRNLLAWESICSLINNDHYFRMFYGGAPCVPLRIHSQGYIVLGIFPYFCCNNILKKTWELEKIISLQITNVQLARCTAII